MKLTPAMEAYVLHWGEMGGRWGMNRSVAQIHALLYLAPEPLDAEEIAETLGIARSNVSNSLKELQSWNLVRLVHMKGERRDYFEAEVDVWAIVESIMEGRKRRELDPTTEVLERCARLAHEDTSTPEGVRERIDNMRETLGDLNGWYEQMRKLPRSARNKVLKLGGQVARLVGE